MTKENMLIRNPDNNNTSESGYSLSMDTSAMPLSVNAALNKITFLSVILSGVYSRVHVDPGRNME